MKIALFLIKHRSDLEQFLPLGLGYLTSYVNARLPELEFRFIRNVEELKDFRPDLVGFSCATAAYPLAKRLARRVKSEFGCAVCIGGVHISTAPKSLDKTFDFGIIGEGERTLYEVCLSWLMRGKFEVEGLSNIQGLTFWKGDELVQTNPRAPIEPLDSIPFPDRKFLGYRGEPAHMMTSRGCPYSCRFCSSSTHWKKFRAFSADYVVAEIENLADEFGTKEIYFYDDLFAFDKERLKKIADGIRRKGLSIKFSCAVRAELVDDETCKLLKEIGVERVWFGAESASNKILKNLKGQSASVESNLVAVQTLAKHGFRVGLSFIIGEPEETEDDALKTYSFIFEQIQNGRIYMADVNILTPFPSTHYWRVALNQGLVAESEDFDWELVARPWRGLLLNQKLWANPFKILASEARVRKMLALYEYPRVAVGIEDASQIPSWLTRYVSLKNADEKEMKQIALDLLSAIDKEDMFLIFCERPDNWEKLLELLWYSHMQDVELAQYDKFIVARGESAKILASELNSFKQLFNLNWWLSALGMEVKRVSQGDIKKAVDFAPHNCDEVSAFSNIVEYFETQNKLKHKIANFASLLWETLKRKNEVRLKFSEKLALKLLGKLFR